MASKNPGVQFPKNCDPSVRIAIQQLTTKIMGLESTPTFAGMTLTGLTASRLIYADADKALTSVSDLTTWIAGTTNQVTVTDDSDGTVTLSLPQNIHTGATPTFAGLTLTGDLVLPKTTGNGIKVDTATPTFGWRDLLGKITNAGGANKPTNATYRSGISQFQFSAGDESIIEFHIPHDYVAGTDIFLHVHWSHIGTFVTGGSLTFTAESAYAKGHEQAAFSAPASGTFVSDTATATQYHHMVSETQLSASSPAGLQLDTDDLEPDGVVLMRLEMTTNNITVSEGAVPDPFIHFVDIHYQSTNIATKAKVPDFYA